MRLGLFQLSTHLIISFFLFFCFLIKYLKSFLVFNLFKALDPKVEDKREKPEKNLFSRVYTSMTKKYVAQSRVTEVHAHEEQKKDDRFSRVYNLATKINKFTKE